MITRVAPITYKDLLWAIDQLHTHPMMENSYNIPRDHVIVDKDEFFKVKYHGR